MKKFLSLVLALVMAMSLVTVSAGAKDFTDSEKLSGEQFEEAVNVMSTMGIIDGYADGSFQPQGTLTRGAAAKIIACMMLGKTTAEALGTQAAPFKDVPVGSTFAGYIAYCSEAGIIDGYSDGTFRPGNTLTGFAFLKMLLTALGYDSAIEGFANNANWTVNVASRAIEAGLTVGNEEFVGTQACTREEACLYATNTLKATLVEYQNKGTSVTINGVEVIQGASTPSVVTSVNANQATSIDDQLYVTGATGQAATWTVEFAEKYQTRLALTEELDEFGRPVHTWTWDREEFGTYIDRDKLITEYTTEVTGRDLYDLLGRYILNNDRLIVTIDGVSDVRRNANIFDADNLVKSNTNAVGDTGNGVLTQVFRDSVDGVIYVAIINTYLAEATDDFDEKNDVLEVEVYGYDTDNDRNIKDLWTDGNNPEGISSRMDADNEDVAVADYKDGDFMMVRIADGQILEVMDPEVISDATLTAFSLTKHTITSGGTVYDQADTRLYDEEVLTEYTAEENLKGLTYNIFLDPYGYFIGLERNEDPDEYVFVTGYDPYTKNLSTAIAEVGAIFVDGSMKTIDVKVDSDLVDAGWRATGNPVENKWYTYSVNSAGVYTLDPVFTATNADPFNNNDRDAAQFAWSYTDAAKSIDKSHVSLPAWDRGGDDQGTANAASSVVYGNADSVYIAVKTTFLENTSKVDKARIIEKVTSTTVGVKNTDIEVDPFEFGVDTIDEDGDIVGTRENASAGVYTLYGDDGYVIAAVVVGENAAASTNYVYVTSRNAEQESYSADEDEHVWTRTVIVNGVETQLTEVGDDLEFIGSSANKGNMQRGEWWKVYYNADDEVMDAELVAGASGDGKVVTDISDIDPDDTVLLMLTDGEVYDADESRTPADLHMKGWTLFLDENNTNGFAVADDAKAVLIEEVDGDQFGEITYYDSKEDNVADAIDDLNTNFNGFLFAIMDDGVATSVIIVDTVNQVTPGGGGAGVAGTDTVVNGDAVLTVDGNGLTAKNVRISTRGNLTYTFGVPAGHANQPVAYDYEVFVDEVRVARGSVDATVSSSNDVDGSINIYEDYAAGDEVVIYIDNVTFPGAPVDDTVELTMDLSNVRLNINGKAYADGAKFEAEVGSVITATIMPTAEAVEGKMVLSELSVTGDANEVTNDGTELTIIAGEDGTLTVAYDYDSYTVSVAAGSAFGWTLGGKTSGSVKAGETVTFTLTQDTADDLDTLPTITVSGLAEDAYEAVLTTEGVAAKDAEYDSGKTYNVGEFVAAVEAGNLYTESSGEYTLVTDVDSYNSGTTYYVRTAEAVEAVEAVITFTFTMPTDDVTVTDITVV